MLLAQPRHTSGVSCARLVACEPRHGLFHVTARRQLSPPRPIAVAEVGSPLPLDSCFNFRSVPGKTNCPDCANFRSTH
eukprot:COSAG06_NODE_11_length_35482_cov_68.929888_27_plen_78_part_00